MLANCCVAWRPDPTPASFPAPGARSSRVTHPFTLDAALDRGYCEGLTLHKQPLENTMGRPYCSLMANLIDRINLL